MNIFNAEEKLDTLEEEFTITVIRERIDLVNTDIENTSCNEHGGFCCASGYCCLRIT